MPLNKQELLPCPFCGGKAKQSTDLIICSNCGVVMDDDISKEKWNARAQPKITVEQVKAMIEKKIRYHNDRVDESPLVSTYNRMSSAAKEALTDLIKEINEAENDNRL